MKSPLIALRASPSLDWIAYAFDAWRKGATLFPISCKLPSFEPLLQYVHCDLLITDENLPSLPLDLSLDGCDLEKTSLLVQTSGSTGTPKIARLSLNNLLASARGALSLLDLRGGDKWLMNLPFHHIAALSALIRCSLAKAQPTFQIEEATHISYVPTQLFRAVDTPLPRRLRCLLIGGAPLSQPLYERAKKQGWPLLVTYGLTEMASLVLASPQPVWNQSECLLGAPLPGREVALAPDGEILLKGPCLFQGYFAMPPQEGWFHTKDLGRKTEDGIWITGRKDWQFISGGENIQPEEIENRLYTFPEIEEALIVPQPDPEFGHRPVLFARFKKAALSLAEIRERLQKTLPSFKIPIALFPLDPPDPNALKRDRKKWINKDF